MEKIRFETDSGTREYYVLESTTLSGNTYILVAESEDEDCEALILKEGNSGDEETAVYTEIEDDTELDAVAEVFGKLLDDTEIEIHTEA
ncbi:MAG: DUF1292 domain-containing protein [Lachnospiraceae bacterium]|nr:DUF1292 domain-containing protein [Lachnospiraceae bacterium]